MEKYDKNLENNLLEMIKEKEKSDKQLLMVEIVMGFVSIGIMLGLCIFAAYAPMEEWLRIVLIIIGFIPVLVLTPFMLKIEQTAGYYECQKCGNRYVPKYGQVFMSMHRGRTRYMKCPKCNKKSWQKKVISKEK